MNLSNNATQDDFVADDFIPEPKNDFVADDFVAEEKTTPSKREPKTSGWFSDKSIEERQKSEREAARNFVKGLASGVSAGFSEHIPGFKIDENASGGTIGKVTGSLIPLSYGAKAIAYPLKAAAKLSPKFVKPLQSLGNLLGLSAAGGIYEGLEESAEKSLEKNEFIPPSPETILKQGGKWAALDASLRSLGLAGRFAKNLYNESFKRGIPAVDLLEEVTNKLGTTDKIAEKALSILEGKEVGAIEKEIKLSQPSPPSKTELVAAEDFSQRVEQRAKDLRDKKVEQKDFSKLKESEASVPEPYLPNEFQPDIIAEEAIESDLTQRIEGVSQRAATEKELGENIQKDIQRKIESHKKETDALYKIASEVEETNAPSVKKTADAIVEQIKKIESGGINLTPEGYNRAKKQLLDTLTDIGYAVETDAAGNIIRAIENQKQPLSRLVEVKKRLNNIINYDLLDTSAQDFLKGPVAQLRFEIREGYGSKNSTARKAFEQAEKQFGEFAENKGKKSIRAARVSEKPESLARVIRTPSGLADLKEVVSPEQFSQIEREILEYFQGQPVERVSSLYRELRPSLSDNARSLAEEIIESKATKGTPARKVVQREAIQKKVLDDIAQSTITGQRPKMALDLWKTKEGQQLIKHSLENNPNKKEILQYLQDQSFKDFSASVITPEGKVDFKKLDSFLKDPATAENIRLVAGEEGLSFLKNLQQLSNTIKRNESIIEGILDKAGASERARIEKEIEKLGEKRLQEIKNKKGKLTKEEEIFQSKFNKQAVKERQEANESKIKLGEDRFKRSKEARKLAEAQSKSGILYKIDELVNSYGFKGKGLLAALGIWKIGAPEALIGITAYEIFMGLAKNKAVQKSIKQAALPQSSPASLIKAIIDIEKYSNEDSSYR